MARAATATPQSSSFLTLRALLRALGLVVSGPLIVLGFAMDLGPEAVVFVLGLDLLVWGRKAPARLEQIGWSNVLVLGGMSRAKMGVAGAIGLVLFAVSALAAAPLPPPPAGELSLSPTIATVGTSVQARAHLAGNIRYAVFRDGTCTEKLQDAGRAQFRNLPIPPSQSVGFPEEGTFYWQAEYEGNLGERVRSGCTPVVVGGTSMDARRATNSEAIGLVVADPPRGGASQATAYFAYGYVSYVLYKEATCRVAAGWWSDRKITGDASLESSAVILGEAGTFFWQAHLVLDQRTVARSACVALEVPKNRPTLSVFPLEGAALGSVSTEGTRLADATDSATGSVEYTLYSDASCTTRLEGMGTVRVSDGLVRPGSIALRRAGTLYWSALYSGDINNEAATSACTRASIERNRPTLSAGSMEATVGQPLLEAPRLNGATASAEGTAAHTLYRDPGSCSLKVSSTDVQVAGGLIPSTHVGEPGTFAMRTTYSGDNNHEAVTSPCWTVVVKRARPILTLTMPTETSIGAAVTAAATLRGAFAPTGQVKFTLANSPACDGLPQIDGGSGPVGPGGLSHSQMMSFGNAGVAYWRATYAGDANNEPASSACEALRVNQNHPTVVATFSSGVVATGTPVHMSASLSGATAASGGQFTFAVYGDSACVGRRLASGGTRPAVSQSSATSNELRFATVGTVWWQVTYTGDPNNTATKSSCLALTIAKARPIITVRLSSTSFGDSVRAVATLRGATSNATGTVTYMRSFSSTCSFVTRLGSVNVARAQVPASQSTYVFTLGPTYWQAEYSGDANNEPASSGCVVIRIQ